MQQRVSVIDISPYFHGSAAERKRIAAFVDATCRDIGFLMIEGHGVPASLGERLYETAERFFAQPIEEKQSLKIPWLDSRGWEGAAASNLAETRAPDGDSHAPDLRESFGIGPLRVPANMSPQEAPFFRGNVWPHWPLEFRDLAIEYYHAMEVLSADILEVFACALDLPPGFFVNKNDRHISHLVVNHYPAQTTDPLPNQLRAGAHTDFGDITILRADPAVGGLQIRDREGNWSDISSPPHAFVVNSATSWRCGQTIGGSRPCIASSTRQGSMQRGSANRLHFSISPIGMPKFGVTDLRDPGGREIFADHIRRALSKQVGAPAAPPCGQDDGRLISLCIPRQERRSGYLRFGIPLLLVFSLTHQKS